MVALDKALKLKKSYCSFVPSALWRERSTIQWPLLASSKVCGKIRSGSAFGPTWIQWIVCFLSTASRNVSGKEGPHDELFFVTIQNEPATVAGSETFSPFFNADIRTPLFSADVLKKCALIALHLIAEEGRGGEDGCHAPGLGDEWKMGCPKSPMWESEGELLSEDESVSSCGSRSHLGRA